MRLCPRCAAHHGSGDRECPRCRTPEPPSPDPERARHVSPRPTPPPRAVGGDGCLLPVWRGVRDVRRHWHREVIDAGTLVGLAVSLFVAWSCLSRGGREGFRSALLIVLVGPHAFALVGACTAAV